MEKSAEREDGVRVFVAEANYMACELALKALGDSGQRITVVGSAMDSAGVLKGLGENSADVAVISANLADGRLTGFQVARKVRASHPNIRIILLIDSNLRVVVVEAFRAGADGVLSRDEPFEMLCKCIHAVRKGQIWASSEQLRLVMEALGKSEIQPIRADSGANLLTHREEELVHWVAEGLTNTDISRQLNLAEHTVRNYLFRIFNKLGVSNRLELALYVIRRREESRVRVPQSSSFHYPHSVLMSDVQVQSGKVGPEPSSFSGTGAGR
jgi:DNA-binding NarL/FixJ family response regulator